MMTETKVVNKRLQAGMGGESEQFKTKPPQTKSTCNALTLLEMPRFHSAAVEQVCRKQGGKLRSKANKGSSSMPERCFDPSVPFGTKGREGGNRKLRRWRST